MGDYIGRRPRKQGSRRWQFMAILILCGVAGSAYAYYNYIWPQHELAQALERHDDSIFAEKLEAALASPEIAKQLAKAHTDGSICFLVAQDEENKPTDEELNAWLGDYGSAKFLEDMPRIERARSLYEAQYLKPTPALFERKLLRKLRWYHLPFGETWRDYTLAARYLEWKALTRGPVQSDDATPEEKHVMKAMQKKPRFFTDTSIKRLAYLARKDLTLTRMDSVRDAVKRFMRDVRELPINEDRTKLELTWLADRDELHPWLKRRWAGPYVKNDMLKDMWDCSFVGTRVPSTGSMTLVSLGSDCKEGGDGPAADLDLAITTYTPKPEPAPDPAPVVKKKSRSRKRNIFLLP